MRVGAISIAGRYNYQGWAPDEGWFILTNLSSLEIAIQSFKRRFYIEDMFRDFKIGVYNLEEAIVSAFRLKSLIVLTIIAYISANSQGKKLK